MVRSVNPPLRKYDSSGRRRQAAATRTAVIDAARSAFLEFGYAATSIPAIADVAGVSAELIYKTIGAKPALLKAVFDTSVTGDGEPIALQQRPEVMRMIAMSDTAQILDGYAQLIVGVLGRLTPVYQLARAAAAAQPAAGAVIEQMNNERLAGMTAMAAQLVGLGQLRQGITATDVRDILWTYNSPELYELLVLSRGWTAEHYVQFIREALGAALMRQ